MPSQSKYVSYRVLQPRVKEPNLFNEGTDADVRIASIRKAIEVGMTSDIDVDGAWIAGSVKGLETGIMFKMGLTENMKNVRPENGELLEFEDRFTKLTDVLIDYPTGLMLIRKDSTTPSTFLAAKAFQRWLESENERRGTGLDSVVQSVPRLDEFVVELEAAREIKSMTFVVRGTNPEDEGAFVRQIAEFTEQHEISSTTVTIHAPQIDQDTARGVTHAAGTMGNALSANIVDSGGNSRTIRTKKKPNELGGPSNPTTVEAGGLLAFVRKGLEKFGVGKKDEPE